MKKLLSLTFISLISISAFAATEECTRDLEVLLNHTKESVRLETEAINRMKKVSLDTAKNDRIVKALLELSQKHAESASSVKESLEVNCLK